MIEGLEGTVLEFIKRAYPKAQHVEVHVVEVGSLNLNSMIITLEVTVAGLFGRSFRKKTIRTEGKIRITDLEIPGV